MFNFFAKQPPVNGRFLIDGSDFKHIKNVLRMGCGDELLISYDSKSSLCVLESLDAEGAVALITAEDYRDTELPVDIILFQGLPKADKMELIIQKCTELGIKEIVPTEMSRCVVRLEEKKKKSKTERWQSIAESAAKQSKRNIIPHVSTPLPFSEALKRISELDLFLVPYENENGMKATRAALSQIRPGMKIGILIGPEGGFDEKEIQTARDIGCKSISLGKRILRTETAAISTVAMCMLYCETKFEE